MAKLDSSFSIAPAANVVEALRSSGYKTPAHALAELLDNSIQASAKHIELLVDEETKLVSKRRRTSICTIAVLDDGVGMSGATLREALRFGCGSRLTDRSGIGRFGMGLPNSSFSQAKKVEVYTWQNGRDSAVYSYLDLEEIKKDGMEIVPEPTKKAIPDHWVERAKELGSNSGTLVVWSKLDRLTVRKFATLKAKSEELIGRMYRYQLASGEVSIRMAAFGESSVATAEHFARPTDPLYLMERTSCPAPWDERAMSEPYGDPRIFEVEFGDAVHEVRVQFSIARPEARTTSDGRKGGSQPHGKHAKRHMGLSVVRADRELELVDLSGGKTIERWIGAEISFPPALDEVFGVTNNKQSATALREMVKGDLLSYAETLGYESKLDLEQAMEEDGDPNVALLEIVSYIQKSWKHAFGSIDSREKKSREKRHRDLGAGSAEVRGTAATRARKEGGFVGGSDAEEGMPAGEREATISSDLEGLGEGTEAASVDAARIVSSNLKFHFTHKALDSGAFFGVQNSAGAIIITLNVEHPAYRHLISVLEPGEHDGESELSAEDRAKAAHVGLRLLLEAWARTEDEMADNPQQRQRARRFREDWGYVAASFFDGEL